MCRRSPHRGLADAGILNPVYTLCLHLLRTMIALTTPTMAGYLANRSLFGSLHNVCARWYNLAGQGFTHWVSG